MYAVIETGGKQYRVSEGDVVRVEKLGAAVGDSVDIETVNLIAGGKDVHIGTPTVEGAKVRATVVEEGRGPKVIAFKKHRRKGYRRKIGHRQTYTALCVNEIVAPGGAKKTKKKTAAKAANKPAESTE